MRRPGVVLATLSVTSLLVPVLAVLGTAPAVSGPAGSWTDVSEPAPNALGSTARPSAVRTADDVLHVVHTRMDGPSDYSVQHVALGEDGEVVSRSTVVSGWDQIDNDPEVLLTPTGLRVIFSGIRSGAPSDFYNDGRAYHATSDASGAAWALQPTALNRTSDSNGSGAVSLADGSTLVAATPTGQTIRFRNEELTDPDSAGADPGFDIDPSQAACCVYDAELVRVPGTDEVWLAWTANDTRPEAGATTDLTIGTFVRRLAPTLGPITRAPGSVAPSDVDGDGTVEDGEVDASFLSGGPGLEAREDGAVFVTYAVGYPTREAVAVWRVGDPEPVLVPGSREPQYAEISVDAAGRVWVVWESRDVVRAARSDRDVSRFGAVVGLGSPLSGGTPNASDLLVDGTGAGPGADVVVNAGGTQLQHQEVLAGLTLQASPTRLEAGRRQTVRFLVTDAGERVGGVRVAVGRVACVTRADGTCAVRFVPDRGRPVARASAEGYTGASVRLRAR